MKKIIFLINLIFTLNLMISCGVGYMDHAKSSISNSTGGGSTSPGSSTCTNGSGTLTIADEGSLDIGYTVKGIPKYATVTINHSGDPVCTFGFGGLGTIFNFKGGTYPGTGGTCGTTISGNCTIVLQFSPQQYGTFSTSLSLNYDKNSQNTISTYTLNGKGLDPCSKPAYTNPVYVYVDLYAIPGGDGSEGSPYMTIVEAIAATPSGTASAPKIFRVSHGTYNQNLNIASKSYFYFEGAWTRSGGTWSRETNIIRPPNHFFYITEIGGNSISINSGSEYVHFEGFKFQAASQVGFDQGYIFYDSTSSHGCISKSSILLSGAREWANPIRSQAKDLGIEDSFAENAISQSWAIRFDDNATGSVQRSFVKGYSTSYSAGGIFGYRSDYMFIANNIITDRGGYCTGEGIQVERGSADIYNNTIYSLGYEDGGSGAAIGIRFNNPTQNSILNISNNIIYVESSHYQNGHRGELIYF